MFRAPHFPFGTLICGKAFGFRAQTIADVTCQQKKEREYADANDFVDESLLKRAEGRV